MSFYLSYYDENASIIFVKFSSPTDRQNLVQLLSIFHKIIVLSEFKNLKRKTPYLHVITHHLQELFRKHEDLDIYNLQGMAKKL